MTFPKAIVMAGMIFPSAKLAFQEPGVIAPTYVLQRTQLSLHVQASSAMALVLISALWPGLPAIQIRLPGIPTDSNLSDGTYDLSNATYRDRGLVNLTLERFGRPS
jgi:hypothetical protein